MTNYEYEFIRGINDENKRIKKAILNLTKSESGSIFFSDVMDIIERRTHNESPSKN